VNQIGYYVRRSMSLPPRVVVRKAVGVIGRKLSRMSRRSRDLREGSHEDFRKVPKGQLYRYVHAVHEDCLRFHAAEISALANSYWEHRFDLLGSGWVKIYHGMSCAGVEGRRFEPGPPVAADAGGRWLEGRINASNLEESRRIWKLIFSDPAGDTYIPIDWHLDFKSGYRWSEKTWYADILYGHKPGVDVKVPREMARMQHLSTLALAYRLAQPDSAARFLNSAEGCGNFASPETYALEFRNQILDFMASNPPRFGVNWQCAMDVAIRVANWLVAYDLFRAFGAKFDEPFESALIWSVYEHAVHIAGNLEWSETTRDNHYLSDIAGLLFAAAYLARTEQTDSWLDFSAQELMKEIPLQFYPDGANVEGSTSYHRLSGEIAAYATALILGLPEEKKALSIDFPPGYFGLLEKIAEFTLYITKPNMHVPQIGDNDSGRFFKLQTCRRRMKTGDAVALYGNLNGYDSSPADSDYWDEDSLDHRHLVAAINGFFKREDFNTFTGGGQFWETELISSLAKGIQVPCRKVVMKSASGTGDFLRQKEQIQRLSSCERHEISIPGEDILKGITFFGFPDFGLYLYKSDRIYLCVRCGRIGPDGRGGHAHSDQLSIELNVDGADWISDPGTYLYTPLPERRNAYRSVKAHFAPQDEGKDYNRLDQGLFALTDRSDARCLCFSEAGFIGMHSGFGFPVYRIITLEQNIISIEDYSAAAYDRPSARFPREETFCDLPFSPGYGKVLRQKGRTGGPI
jgi:hypothetical protein